ncbi:similar to Saccharomyces cerevisiae YMR160W Putative protein of unknown function [Maudiozyma barnettii]|uniref:Uncharacterized protein n=1 Tax=Maudiozyma barnettii TaxID=61262 RepID=A0A8H2VF70_9SACH|nr:hypothetical protein [Kazachstania barnettii]CAB4254494.1 similar to Saccharomyces cerevisiae YMR160W Putative protein of unknown function [Kazachstania barnettii]CAD1782499.1 similar to Saccharomyces cerevisiae YMR160W Putative protein of unknown function [Kazachstania barnettii]
MEEETVNEETQPLPSQPQQTSWFSWWGNNDKINDSNNNNGIENQSNNIQNTEITNENNGWYTGLMSTVNALPIPTFRSHVQSVNVDDSTRYSQLDVEQIEFLESEAKNVILQHSHSWCWFEDLTKLDKDLQSWTERPGVASVYDTGSGRCPLPLPKYPMDTHPGYHVYIKNSLLLPQESPSEIYHTEPLRTKIATGFKDYYNFPNGKHLYLKDSRDDLIKKKKTIIISVVGWLPEKYEKLTLGEQRTAQYFSKKLAQSLKHESPSEILSLSFECPLDSKELNEVFDECTLLLRHWEHIFKDATAIYFVGVYHSVPLLISLAKYILSQNEKLKFDKKAYVGMLAIESCFQGYRFWDHSIDSSLTTDTDNVTAENDYSRMQKYKERSLFQGLHKNEQDVLSKIKNYRDIDSEESKLLQGNLDWLLYNWDSFRLSMVGKLYDNFMTVTQKLAIDYFHPKIIRNVWVDGQYFDLDSRQPEELHLPDYIMKTPRFEYDLTIPDRRKFEISLIDNFLLTQNIGRQEFVSILKLISPFFISRSYNPNTITPSLKKQRAATTKQWFQQMETKWNTIEPTFGGNFSFDELPESISTIHNFLEYTQYLTMKSPELFQTYSEIYDDDLIFKNFIENTLLTRKPLTNKHLVILRDNLNPTSILNTVNQYDLVWKFHESLCNFIKIKNVPIQDYPKCLHFTISLDSILWRTIYNDPKRFERNNKEAIHRLKQLLDSYQTWDPPTKGLVHLKNVLSVLSSYDSVHLLIEDIQT